MFERALNIPLNSNNGKTAKLKSIDLLLLNTITILKYFTKLMGNHLP